MWVILAYIPKDVRFYAAAKSHKHLDCCPTWKQGSNAEETCIQQRIVHNSPCQHSFFPVAAAALLPMLQLTDQKHHTGVRLRRC